MKKLLALLMLLASYWTMTPAWACRDFNGTSDLITIADADSLSFTDGAGTDKPFTLLAWAYNTDFTLASSVMGKDDYIGTTPRVEYYLYELGVASTINVAINDNTASSPPYRGRTGPYTSGNYQNKWVSSALVYDGTEATTSFKIYLNSTRVDDTNVTSGTYNGMGNTTARFFIGARFNTPSYGLFFKGRICEVKVWSIALTQDEITLASFGIPVRPDKMVLYAPLFGVSSPEPDVSGNGNNGTLTGTARYDHPPSIVGEWQ